jgi:hypothetical protein
VPCYDDDELKLGAKAMASREGDGGSNGVDGTGSCAAEEGDAHRRLARLLRYKSSLIMAGMAYSGGEDEFDGSYPAQIQQILICCPSFSISQKRELPGANLRRAPMPQSPFFLSRDMRGFFLSRHRARSGRRPGADRRAPAPGPSGRALSSSSSSDSYKNPRAGPLVHPGPQWRRRARA